MVSPSCLAAPMSLLLIGSGFLVDTIASPLEASRECAIIGTALRIQSALLRLCVLLLIGVLLSPLIGLAHCAEQRAGSGADRRTLAGIAPDSPAYGPQRGATCRPPYRAALRGRGRWWRRPLRNLLLARIEAALLYRPRMAFVAVATLLLGGLLGSRICDDILGPRRRDHQRRRN